MIIKHPSDSFKLDREMSQRVAQPMVKKAGLLLASRMLYRGEVYIPNSVWDESLVKREETKHLFDTYLLMLFNQGKAA